MRFQALSWSAVIKLWSSCANDEVWELDTRICLHLNDKCAKTFWNKGPFWSSCALTQEAFHHVILYVCECYITFANKPCRQLASRWDLHQIPVAIVGTFLTQRYSIIPTMCGFSRDQCSLHGPWRIPQRRGDQLLVIATRLGRVRVGIAKEACEWS